jgi:hypothetical protein
MSGSLDETGPSIITLFETQKSKSFTAGGLSFDAAT